MDKAIEIGLQKNKNIQASILNAKSSKQLTKSAFELPKTEFTGNFGQLNSFEKDKNFSVSQSFNPFQINARKKMLNENSNASQTQINIAKQELTYSIRQAWNNMLFLETQNKLFNELNSVYQKFVKAASLRYSAGETNALEKNIANAKQQQLEQKLKQTTTQIEIEKSKIKVFLDLKSDFNVPDTLFVANTIIADSVLIQQNPNIKLAFNHIEVAKANQKFEKSALYPEFSAGYFMQSLVGTPENNSNTLANNSLQFSGFSVGIALPIFVGSSIAKSKAAKTKIEMEEMNLNYMQMQIHSQFSQQVEQLNTFKSNLQYYKETALPNAKEILKNASKEYQNGNISYLEYANSLETASDIQLKYNEAILNYNLTIINLQYLTNQ